MKMKTPYTLKVEIETSEGSSAPVTYDFQDIDQVLAQIQVYEAQYGPTNTGMRIVSNEILYEILGQTSVALTVIENK